MSNLDRSYEAVEPVNPDFVSVLPDEGTDDAGIFSNKLLWFIGLIALGVLSFMLFSRLATSAELIGPIRDTLQVQQNRVTGMAATSTALSVALSALPGDLASPIANQLADLSGYFVVILAAIFLQKMLFGFVGYVVFRFIIPLACLLGILAIARRSEFVGVLAIKLAIFGVVLFTAVPLSIGVSGAMNNIQEQVMGIDYSYSDSLIDPSAQLPVLDEFDEDEGADNTGFWNGVANLFRRAANAVGETVTGAVRSTQEAVNSAVQAFNNFIERIAWFIITTLIIPLLTIALVAWVIKLLFGFDLKPGKAARGLGRRTSSGVSRAGRKVNTIVNDRY